MATTQVGVQYKYTGKGPIDAKSLVDTYAALLSEETWLTTSGSRCAYNGMIVSVWLNKDDPTKNGIYYLFDPNCTTKLKNPDVTNPANWIKIGSNSEIPALTQRIQEIDTALQELTRKVDELTSTTTKTYTSRKDFPVEGVAGCLYVAQDLQRTYAWIDNKYLVVGAGFEETADGELIINGGTAI